MSSREPMPSLADLRRKGKSKTDVRPEMPGLFDALPAEPAAEDVPVTSKPSQPSQLPAATSPELPSEPRVWSVAELVRQVRSVLERSYGQVIVEGEISNWRPAATGHCYFTLKDGAAQLSVVMLRRQ